DVVTGPGQGGGPHVRVFSGRNLTQVMLNFNALAPTFRGGIFVAAGDIDADGRDDVIVGAGVGGNSQVREFSGAAGGLIASLTAFPSVPGSTQYAGDALYGGSVRVAARDLTGDGRADVLAVPGSGGRPIARIFSGGTLVGTVGNLFDPTFLGGVFVG